MCTHVFVVLYGVFLLCFVLYVLVLFSAVVLGCVVPFCFVVVVVVEFNFVCVLMCVFVCYRYAKIDRERKSYRR